MGIYDNWRQHGLPVLSRATLHRVHVGPHTLQLLPMPDTYFTVVLEDAVVQSDSFFFLGMFMSARH